MNLELFNPEGAKSESQLHKDQSRMEETLESLKQERNFLEKEIMNQKNRFEQGPGSADFTGEETRERQQKEQEQQRKEKIEQDGLKIGSFNINSLDTKVKYGVGLGLLGLCALIIWWFMKELSINKGRDSPSRNSGSKKRN